jgi:hypothetical protein
LGHESPAYPINRTVPLKPSINAVETLLIKSQESGVMFQEVMQALSPKLENQKVPRKELLLISSP